MIEPLRFTFVVRCPVERAFEVWTAKASLWWPIDHSVSRQPGLAVIFEPWVGGRIYERTPTGGEFDWGEILAWDQPARLQYSWHITSDASRATRVEITFEEDEARNTLVTIIHDGWDAFTDGLAMRQGNNAGWDGVLPRYQNACIDLAL